MVIGVPKEIKEQEFRVALLPSGAYQLIKRGHKVIVEKNAGAGSGYPDADYTQAGATILDSHEAVFDRPTRRESEGAVSRRVSVAATRPDSVHLPASGSEPLFDRGSDQVGCTAIAYETIEVNRHLPFWNP